MPEIKQIRCPNCTAPIDVAPKPGTIICAYCESLFSVQPNSEDMLHAEHQRNKLVETQARLLERRERLKQEIRSIDEEESGLKFWRKRSKIVLEKIAIFGELDRLKDRRKRIVRQISQVESIVAQLDEEIEKDVPGEVPINIEPEPAPKSAITKRSIPYWYYNIAIIGIFAIFIMMISDRTGLVRWIAIFLIIAGIVWLFRRRRRGRTTSRKP